MQFGCPET